MVAALSGGFETQIWKRTSKDRALSMSAAASDLLAKNRNGIERSRTIGFSVRFTSSSRAIAIRAGEVVVVVNVLLCMVPK